MRLLAEAGRSFLRAFAGALVVLAPGVLAAPNLNDQLALAVAAVGASVIAGFKAVQVFVPQLAVGYWLTKLVPQNWPLEVFEDSFARAFAGTFLVLAEGVWVAPDLASGKALAVAALVGAVTAGFRAVQALLTKGETPIPALGLAR